MVYKPNRLYYNNTVVTVTAKQKTQGGKQMETYTSKKDKNVKATIEQEEEKYGTVMMCYVSGPDKGKTFSITKSTLKRWWDKDEVSFMDTIDFEKVNEPYPEPKVQKYIKKPQSVLEYEAKKGKKYNNDLPQFEQIVEQIQEYASKINDRSKYITLPDKTTVWRKTASVTVYATEGLWTKLTEVGLTSKPNKDKDRPFAFTIQSTEDYEKFLEVLSNV